MDRYSILGEASLQVEPETLSAPKPKPQRSPVATETPASSDKVLRFPGEDGGQSLSEMADRDLDAALQLLAERAHYITSASGSAIGIIESGEMICRASAGPLAPQVGSHLAASSGLSLTAAQRQQMLRCDNALEDPRANRENCRRLGIVSAMAAPLLLDDQSIGAFELLSGSPHAFEEHDVAALQRLAEMIQTAVEHAHAVKRSHAEMTGEKPFDALALNDAELSDLAARTIGTTFPPEEGIPADMDIPAAALESDFAPAGDQAPLVERGDIRTCQACGFPVSAGRELCLDCEAAARQGGTPPLSGSPADVPEATLTFGSGDEDEEEGWVSSHKFVLAGLLAAAVVITILLWLH